jgi:hypothetical protein
MDYGVFECDREAASVGRLWPALDRITTEKDFN